MSSASLQSGVFYNEGEMTWLVGGKLHHEDGPARIWRNGTQGWYQNGCLHRLDGPAFITLDGYQGWWVKGYHITSEVREWMEQMSIRPDWKNWGDVEKTLFRLRF